MKSLATDYIPDRVWIKRGDPDCVHYWDPVAKNWKAYSTCRKCGAQMHEPNFPMTRPRGSQLGRTSCYYCPKSFPKQGMRRIKIKGRYRYVCDSCIKAKKKNRKGGESK